MATRMLVFSVLLILSGAAKAQTNPDCNRSIVTLAPCLSFVSGDSSLPSASCCTALKPVIDDHPVCLCLLIGYGGDSSSVPADFNQTLAKELPGLCSLNANEEKCPALVGGTPTVAPAASGPAPPPSTGNEPAPGSAAATLLSSFAAILSCTAVAFFASFL